MVVLLAIRLHLVGLPRRAGLVDGELRRSASLQILGDCLDQVGQQGSPAALPGGAGGIVRAPEGDVALGTAGAARFQSIVTSPVMMMVCSVLFSS